MWKVHLKPTNGQKKTQTMNFETMAELINYSWFCHRIGQSILKIVSQNCKHIRTFVDIDKVVGLMCIEETEKQKIKWKSRGITIQTATQPLQGIVGCDENLKLFEDI